MKRAIEVLVLGGFAVALGAIVYATGMVKLSAPSLPSVTTIEVEMAVPEEAKIIAVEPISLSCQARVFAQVPVEGKREHEAFGVVYRTDRISMQAYGDVDTCVDGSGAAITNNDDGTTEVVIDGESILFVRPRVDAVRTAGTVDIDKDAVGKLVDAFPWVDDNMGLTPTAYAYAQNVIGSSRCMRAAYSVTEEMLIDAYRQQVIDQGADPELLSVTVDGQPNFTDPAPIEMGDLEMRVGTGDIVCTTDSHVGGPTSQL